MAKIDRKLEVKWEDTAYDLAPYFHSDKTKQVDWFDTFIKRYTVVFNYSESNPRLMDDGSDAVPENSPDYDQDDLAKNLDGVIGHIVDYYVHDDDCEVSAHRASPLWDHVVIKLLDETIVAGFDEVLFTERKNKDEPRVVSVAVYRHMLAYSLPFIEKAYLNAFNNISNRYSDNPEEQARAVKDCTSEYLQDVNERLEKPYTYVGERKIEVPMQYKGTYRIFIDDDGSERLR